MVAPSLTIAFPIPCIWFAPDALVVQVLSRALVHLNLETRAHHAGADEAWLLLTREEATKIEYAHQLVSVYGFEAPLEAALTYTPNLRPIVDLRARSRAGLAAQDLLALGMTAIELAKLRQCRIEPFKTPLEALGWMYVNERATLHFEAVRTNLAHRFDDIGHAVAYLTAYRGNVNLHWNELGEIIDRIARTPHMMVRVVAAAHEAFECSCEWRRTDVPVHAPRHG